MGRSRLLAALAATILLVSGCGGTGDDASATTLKLPDKVTAGVIPIVDVAPIYLGREKGFFRSENIDLYLTSAQGGAAIVPAVLSGEFQFGFSNTVSLLLSASQNKPIKVVSNGTNSTGVSGKDYAGLYVRGGSKVRSAKDLVGKTVAVNTLKNIVVTTVKESVRKAGGDPDGVKFAEVAFPDQVGQLKAGKVDAIFVVEPYQHDALEVGARKIASSYVDAAADLTVAMYFTSQQLIAADPDLVARFTRAMNRSMEYADKHPDEVRAVLGSYTKIDPFVREELVLPKFPAGINKESVEAVAKLAITDELFAEQPDLATLLPS